MELDDIDLLSIRQKYQNTLSLPNDLPPTQIFVCTVGLVGAGKSTVIKPLSEKLSLVRISTDEIRAILKERNVGYEQLMKIVQPIVEDLAGKGFSLAFDADCGNPKTKEMITQLAKKINAEVFWIHIDPPENFIINKLKNYKHTWLFKNAEEAVDNYFMQKEKRKEENTPFNFLVKIDTSRPDLQLQIDNTFELINKNLSK